MLVTLKIFLKSRFFLISNTGKPLEKLLIKHKFAKWTPETTLISNAFDYLCRYFHSLKIGKYWNIILENLKKVVSLKNGQKLLIFPQMENFSFINRKLGLKILSFLKSSNLCTKILVGGTICVKSQFLKLRFICTYQIDLSINFRSIHSHSEVIVEFSVVFVMVSAIRGYNDIINFLKEKKYIYL